ncbi:lysozyme [Actinophytocola gossypii]|uniref:Lysozyme n=1 Tax=Actinophytocola gossypii TaxID=2812003 RepID=A0ABT2JEV6_9PSEU|nr:lysozyme [Actinophytocola gossypii]MCT2585970.1 lysozyme [Actinophytocola gossypii]
MNSIFRDRRRGLLSVAAAAISVVTAAVLASPASADQDATPAGDQAAIDAYVRKYDHPMGSQIRKHEDTSAMPATVDPRDVGVMASVPGIDVSGWQGNVDWNAQWNAGKRFVWVKATEGTGYTSPYFAQQYNGSYNRGFIRGAYHFALPDRSSGAAQATFFSNNGGGWSGDGKTLPGALDMEYNPYGATCYGKSKSAMAAWIRDFSDTYHARWNKYPAIYTSTSWWNQCVGASFSRTNPLWVARYSSTVGQLPYDWSFYTVWQYSSTPIDQNTFNGSYDRLQVFATNSD